MLEEVHSLVVGEGHTKKRVVRLLEDPAQLLEEERLVASCDDPRLLRHETSVLRGDPRCERGLEAVRRATRMRKNASRVRDPASRSNKRASRATRRGRSGESLRLAAESLGFESLFLRRTAYEKCLAVRRTRRAAGRTRFAGDHSRLAAIHMRLAVYARTEETRPRDGATDGTSRRRAVSGVSPENTGLAGVVADRSGKVLGESSILPPHVLARQLLLTAASAEIRFRSSMLLARSSWREASPLRPAWT